MKVVIGTIRLEDGETIHKTRPVIIEGKLLGRHQWRTSETGGVRQRLFRTAGGRYIVSVATWTAGPSEETTYTLQEIEEADLRDGGEFEDLGRAAFGDALELDAALSIEEALEVLRENRPT